mmetsp:Transcript_41562/g.105893  ORF Transcript_41562/g.105893 Transcript_41562/m.105893 type:complete len:264 (-) Transcript_41562:191-982(-)
MEAGTGSGRVQWPLLPLSSHSNNSRSLRSILDGTLDVVVQEGDEAQAAPLSWGPKSEHSVFDEEEILVCSSSHKEEDQQQMTHSSPPSSGFGSEQLSAHSRVLGNRMWTRQLWRSSSLHGSTAADQVGIYDNSRTSRNVGPMERFAQEAEMPAVMGPSALTSAVIAAWLSPSDLGEPCELRAIRRACCAHTLETDVTQECPICLEPLLQDQMAWRLPCMHLVHSTCAVQYFKRRGVKPHCPVCRCDARSMLGSIKTDVGICDR